MVFADQYFSVQASFECRIASIAGMLAAGLALASGDAGNQARNTGNTGG